MYFIFHPEEFRLVKRQAGAAAQSCDCPGFCRVFSFSGSMNGDLFLDYKQHDLVPTLHAGDLVIMDNLRCHKVRGVKEAIEHIGAQVLYLPPYSPDFNPIEMMWSKSFGQVF